MGERTPRRLLIIGGSAVVLQASKRGAPAGSWLEQMMARKPRMLVTVALANKTARIIWALLVKQEEYKAPVAAAKTLIAALEGAARPVLIHCKAGAYRTGLDSALFEYLVVGRTAEEASGQLSFLYGHFPWYPSQTGAMDRTFWDVAEGSLGFPWGDGIRFIERRSARTL